MGNKQSNCLVKARAPFDPLLWNQDDVENIAAAYKESAPKDGMVTPDDMARVLQELDGAVIFQYGDGRVFGTKDVCEKLAGLLVVSSDDGDDDDDDDDDDSPRRPPRAPGPPAAGTLDPDQFEQTLKLVLVLYQVLASDPKRIAEVRENPFNAVMMMEQIAIAAAIQEAEEEAQAEKEAIEKVKNGTAATSTETIDV
jgi:hypothetical protein